MAKAGNRIIFSLECQTCKRRNYSTTNNKRTSPEKVKLKKICRFCRLHN
jgi:large subunit ribosomal protein L33